MATEGHIIHHITMDTQHQGKFLLGVLLSVMLSAKDLSVSVTLNWDED